MNKNKKKFKQNTNQKYLKFSKELNVLKMTRHKYFNQLHKETRHKYFNQLHKETRHKYFNQLQKD